MSGRLLNALSVVLGIALCLGTLLSCGEAPGATAANDGDCGQLLVHSRDCNLSAAKDLISNRRLIDCRNSSLETPLMMAARGDCEEVAYLLLEAGADSKAKASRGENALFYAALSGGNAIVKRLLADDVSPNVYTEDRWVPLFAAAANGHREVVSTLVDAGAEVDWRASDNSVSETSVTAIALANKCATMPTMPTNPNLPTESDEGTDLLRINTFEVSFVGLRPSGGCYPEIEEFLRSNGGN